MTAGLLASSSALTGIASLAGAGLGAGYFWALRRTTSLYAAGGGMLLPALLTLGRMAAAVLGFTLAAKAGAAPLLAAAAGFLAARSLALRAVRRSL
jgi:N-ATPase, AtpR subunit